MSPDSLPELDFNELPADQPLYKNLYKCFIVAAKEIEKEHENTFTIGKGRYRPHMTPKGGLGIIFYTKRMDKYFELVNHDFSPYHYWFVSKGMMRVALSFRFDHDREQFDKFINKRYRRETDKIRSCNSAAM
jgi:hypothetical protein